MSVLFGENGNNNSISFVKKDEREYVARDGSIFGYSYQTLAHKYYNKNFEPYIMTVPANPKRDRNFHFAHTGEEMLLILKGKMEFYYDDQKFLLDEGDCLYFDASVPHNGFCRDGDKVECLLVIYTPK
jgi:mannose-6-phosphate isomerase-like protein (cupin superfamily)